MTPRAPRPAATDWPVLASVRSVPRTRGSGNALDLPDEHGTCDGHDGRGGEQRGISAERDERRRDPGADGRRADDRDVDDAEVLGTVPGGGQHLRYQGLVDGEIRAEADAEQDRRADRR